MPLGDNLMDLRRRKSWTQVELSDASGVQVGHISKLERGTDTDPKLSTIRKLIGALGCRPDELLLDKDEMGPHGRLQAAFRAAEELPEDAQSAILLTVEAFTRAHGMEKLMGGKLVLPMPWPFERKTKAGAD